LLRVNKRLAQKQHINTKQTVAQSMGYSSGKIDQVRLEDLAASERAVGQIYPVVKDADGNIIDGFHRKRVNPNWKEVQLPVKDRLEALKIRVHLNLFRRKVGEDEKSGWVAEARRLLQERGLKGTQDEIAKALGVSQPWVSKYDPEPIQPNKPHASEQKVLRRNTFCNIWGFEDDSWLKLTIRAQQPHYDFYHGVTPAFVIENLIQLYQPKRVLDSMAGVGTTGWVCRRYSIECDQFDINPFGEVKEGDAEHVETGRKYDLIFNHIPYLDLVKYSDKPEDLSNLPEDRFFEKLRRIFEHNLTLLEEGGVYAVLVGDVRRGGRIIPLTAKATLLGLEVGYILHDQAIKITGESESTSGLLQYRAAKYRFMIPKYDTILIFKKVNHLE